MKTSDPPVKGSYPFLPQIGHQPTQQAVRLIYDRLESLEALIAQVNQANAFSGQVAGGGHRVTDLADPVDPQDAVTKQYLQSYVAASQAAAVSVSATPPTVPVPPRYPNPPPGGPPQGDNHVFTDSGGPFHAFGTSLFWAFWGYRNDRERLAQNLQYFADRGGQYVRVLGCVGGASWADRAVDPGMDPGTHLPSAAYLSDLALFTDWVYDVFHLRTHWTIFGGSPYTPTLGDRTNLVAAFGAMAAGREEKILCIEIANEGWNNDFPGAAGLAELQTHTATLQGLTTVLVAATSSPNGEFGGSYGASAIYTMGGSIIGDVTTWHLDRTVTGECLLWRPCKQPYDLINCPGVPSLHMNDEPIGPQSSGVADDDPTRLAAAAAVGYAMGVGAYTLHTGAGVRGGGAADLALGRASNLWEVANIEQILQSQRHVRDLIPLSAENWAKFNTNASFPERPFDFNPLTADVDGLVCRLYGSWSGNEFVGVAINIGAPCGVTCRDTTSHHMGIANVAFYDILSGSLVSQTALGIGDSVNFPGGYPALILRGTWN